MNEENNNNVAAQAEEAPDTLVKFAKPYHFEGQTYTDIDLAGLETLTAEDMIAAEKFLNRSGVFSPIPEMTTEYVSFIAAKASGQPIEFFKRLPPKDAVRVKNRVTSFFYGED
jgi:hypothetical protein